MDSTFSAEEIMEFLNRGKDMILNQLIKDNHISLTLAQKISKEYLLSYVKPSSTSGVWGNLFKNQNGYKFIVTKIVDTAEWEAEIKEQELDWGPEINVPENLLS